MKLLINNKTKYQINETKFRQLLKIIDNEDLNLKLEEMSLVFIGSKEIAELNQIYRGKQGPCTVLSFEYGEILICPQYIKKKYKIKNDNLEEKFIELFVHGLAHIAGFDHKKEQPAKKMQKLEEKLLKCYYENSSNVK